MKKIFRYRFIYGVLIPFSLVLLVFIVWKPFEAVQFIPSENSFYTVNTYSDSIKGLLNASQIVQQKRTSTFLSFTYTLGKGNQHPFAGISIQAKGTSHFDLSPFDKIDLTLKASQGKRIQLFLGVYATGYTQSNNRMTYRYLVKDLDLQKNKNHYSIPLREFTTATWWYADNDVSEKDLKKIEFNKTKIINIQNCQLLNTNIPDTITVTGLSFAKDTGPFYWVCISLLSSYYLGWAFFLYYKNAPKQHIQKVEIHYNPIAVDLQGEEESQKIVSFISSHYQDPELSLRKIQQATGISETKVSTLLKEKFTLSFKQYLNQLRLNEAKRLLLETELPVSDIAYKVGYGNISHFNRVFKEAETFSPNDFRKKIKN